jgi:hypothetical protein
MDFDYVDLLLLSVQKTLPKVFENSCFECLQILASATCESNASSVKSLPQTIKTEWFDAQIMGRHSRSGKEGKETTQVNFHMRKNLQDPH